MDKCRGMGRRGPWIGGKLTERPSAIFRSHVRVTPYPEDDVVKIVGQLGQCDSIVMGSDFPHAEGFAEPARFADLLAASPPASSARSSGTTPSCWPNHAEAIAREAAIIKMDRAPEPGRPE